VILAFAVSMSAYDGPKDVSQVVPRSKDKIFVVERENSALAVIENNMFKNEITGLHNFNHAVVKFRDNDGYVITRDGYVIKFDPIAEKNSKSTKPVRVPSVSLSVIITSLSPITTIKPSKFSIVISTRYKRSKRVAAMWVSKSIVTIWCLPVWTVMSCG